MSGMDDLDATLKRLVLAPVPEALDEIEGRVLARIGRRSPAYRPGIGLAAVTIAALALGMVGGEVTAGARTSGSLAPLAGTSPLAPSNLLAGDR